MSGGSELESLELLGRRLAAALYPEEPAPRRARVWLPGLGALAAAAAAAAALILAIGSGTSATPVARALDRAAQAAARSRPAPILRAGQFWYTRTMLEMAVPTTPAESLALSGAGSQTRGYGGMSFVIGRLGPQPALPRPGVGVERVLSEIWVGVNGTFRIRLTPLGPPRFANARDRAQFRASGEKTAPPPADVTARGNGYFPPGTGDLGQGLFTYRQLLALPTNPHVLYRRLAAGIRAAQLRLPEGASVLAHEGREGFAAQTLFFITALLDSPTPPRLQAALYRAAALVPGTRYDGKTYDLSHRAGVGISVGGIQLIFNPATGALLGTRHPGLGGETRTAVLATGISDTINARPQTP